MLLELVLAGEGRGALAAGERAPGADQRGRRGDGARRRQGRRCFGAASQVLPARHHVVFEHGDRLATLVALRAFDKALQAGVDVFVLFWQAIRQRRYCKGNERCHIKT